MNPLRDSAIWAVSMLPDGTPEIVVGTVGMLAIFATLAAIPAPFCLLAGWLAYRKECRDGLQRPGR